LKTKEKWTLHVYGDNHRIIEITIYSGVECVCGHVSVLFLLE